MGFFRDLPHFSIKAHILLLQCILQTDKYCKSQRGITEVAKEGVSMADGKHAKEEKEELSNKRQTQSGDVVDKRDCGICWPL